MAVKMTRIDDLDGTEDADLVEFGFDGKQWEIDLSAKNVAKLRKALDPFLTVAREKGTIKASTSKPRRRSTPIISKADQMNAIRAWGRANGRKVSDRGRVPRDVVDAFNEAHAVSA